ncbi:MAG: tyrosine-type recombinase/integrase [Verrucomicrobiales bacterium]|nr:tyrosine-type recombinase/integrase [Verrucomicrobiales bacterium]
MGRLKANSLSRLPPGKYGDGDNLWLVVKPTGRRAWSFRFMRHGKARELGLGSWPAVTLAHARVKAFDMRQNLALGRGAGAPAAATFAAVARDYVARQRPSWRNKKHANQWESTLEQYVFPVIAHLPVAEITTGHVLAILSPIWSTKPETASRVRGRIEAVMSAARAEGLAPDGGTNPAQWKGHLAHLLPPRSRVRIVKHHAALSFEATRALYRKLETMEGSAARALRFLILTAARTSEVIGARRNEIDTDGVWTIPAHRMKSGRAHRVPLVSAAMRLAEHDAANSDLLFPGKDGRVLSNMAMAMVLRRQGARATVHGFRSVFRDWAAHNGASRETAESCLAHTLGPVERAYLRSDLLEARRALLAAWAAAVAGR